jgi:hypothetical protein
VRAISPVENRRLFVGTKGKDRTGGIFPQPIGITGMSVRKAVDTFAPVAWLGHIPIHSLRAYGMNLPWQY